MDREDVATAVHLDDIVVYRNDPVLVWHESKLVPNHLAAAGFMINSEVTFLSWIKMLVYKLCNGRRLPYLSCRRQ